MLDVTKLLDQIKASPYEEMEIVAPHCGRVEFADIKPGAGLAGPSGTWKEKPGTLLATIERERNKKNVWAPQKGELVELYENVRDNFVQAGTPLLKLRHFLSKEEVLRIILKEALYLFTAPERAKYYFTPEVDIKVKSSGCKTVTVRQGMELFIVSRMKREAPLLYDGPDGVIYAVYFDHNSNVDAGEPLIGVCPPQQISLIEDVVVRVQTEWVERD